MPRQFRNLQSTGFRLLPLAALRAARPRMLSAIVPVVPVQFRHRTSSPVVVWRGSILTPFVEDWWFAHYNNRPETGRSPPAGPATILGKTCIFGHTLAIVCNACCFSTSCRSSIAARWRCLRQPLEDGTVTISRALSSTTFPGQLHADRGAQPLPLRLSQRSAARLPLHGAADRAVHGQDQRPAAGPDRHPHRSARRPVSRAVGRSAAARRAPTCASRWSTRARASSSSGSPAPPRGTTAR